MMPHLALFEGDQHAVEQHIRREVALVALAPRDRVVDQTYHRERPETAVDGALQPFLFPALTDPHAPHSGGVN